MPAVDDLTELVENAAAAERIVLSSKWKDRPDVDKMVRRVRKNADEQRADLDEFTDSAELSSRWVSLRQDYLDLGAQESLPEPELTPEQEAADEQTGRRAGQGGAHG